MNTEPLVDAHEWECETCKLVVRQKVDPTIIVSGVGVCSTCGSTVKYRIVKGVPESSLGGNPKELLNA